MPAKPGPARDRLPASDAQVHTEARTPYGAGPWALADDAAAQRSPGANATDAADGAPGPADPLSRGVEPEPDHAWHMAAAEAAEVAAAAAVEALLRAPQPSNRRTV
jgi:hypothetical protein